MSTRNLPRFLVTGIGVVLTAATLTACSGSDAEPTAGPAGASAAPAATVVAQSTPAGKFKLTVPAAYKQGKFTTENPVVRLIPTSAVDGEGDNDDIVVESLHGTGTTPESRFSFYAEGLKKTYPSCKFATGADHVADKIAEGFTANYVVYKCEAMPFTFVNFTSRGPDGLQVAGYQESTTGDVESWKAAVGSIVKG